MYEFVRIIIGLSCLFIMFYAGRIYEQLHVDQTIDEVYKNGEKLGLKGDELCTYRRTLSSFRMFYKVTPTHPLQRLIHKILSR